MDPFAATRASYDRVADDYAEQIGGELANKPLDRALYQLFAQLVRQPSGTAGDPTPRVGDVGCGPGHLSVFLADLGVQPVGVDLSPRMVAVAAQRYPGLTFRVGSFTDLGESDGAWAGAVAAYSIIHLGSQERADAWTELARVVRPGGLLLVAFHVSTADQPAGSTYHATTWWDHPVDLHLNYLAPDVVEAELVAAGWHRYARVEREPLPGVEHPSSRCYLLARHG